MRADVRNARLQAEHAASGCGVAISFLPRAFSLLPLHSSQAASAAVVATAAGITAGHGNVEMASRIPFGRGYGGGRGYVASAAPTPSRRSHEFGLSAASSTALPEASPMIGYCAAAAAVSAMGGFFF